MPRLPGDWVEEQTEEPTVDWAAVEVRVADLVAATSEAVGLAEVASSAATTEEMDSVAHLAATAETGHRTNQSHNFRRRIC
jgi:hypothetical protein